MYVRPEPGGLRASRNLLLLAVELKEKAAELRLVDGGRVSMTYMIERSGAPTIVAEYVA